MSAQALARSALLEVEHVTRYEYAAPVELAHHLAHLHPLDGGLQQVQDFRFEVLPAPMHRVDDLNRLGNRRSCFTLNEPHRELEVATRSRVRVQALDVPDAAATAPWEAVRERLRYAAGRPYEPASEFVQQSPYVPLLPGLKRWAASAGT